MKVISDATEIALPSHFKCPICGEDIYIEEVDSWIENGDGTWSAEAVKIDCTTFPGFDDHDAFNAYMSGHYRMPYVDWLPVEQMVTEWVNQNYTWEI